MTEWIPLGLALIFLLTGEMGLALVWSLFSLMGGIPTGDGNLGFAAILFISVYVARKIIPHGKA